MSKSQARSVPTDGMLSVTSLMVHRSRAFGAMSRMVVRGIGMHSRIRRLTLSVKPVFVARRRLAGGERVQARGDPATPANQRFGAGDAPRLRRQPCASARSPVWPSSPASGLLLVEVQGCQRGPTWSRTPSFATWSSTAHKARILVPP